MTARVEVTLYDVLGVAPDASAAQVKAAYRALMKRCHPDVCGEDGDDGRAASINEAYAVLSQPHRRADYDRGLRESSDAGDPADAGDPWDDLEDWTSEGIAPKAPPSQEPPTLREQFMPPHVLRRMQDSAPRRPGATQQPAPTVPAASAAPAAPVAARTARNRPRLGKTLAVLLLMSVAWIILSPALSSLTSRLSMIGGGPHAVTGAAPEPGTCRMGGSDARPRPDADCTTGTIATGITLEAVCAGIPDARPPLERILAAKTAVAAAYSRPDARVRPGKVGLLIPIALGGTWDYSNLWPGRSTLTSADVARIRTALCSPQPTVTYADVLDAARAGRLGALAR